MKLKSILLIALAATTLTATAKKPKKKAAKVAVEKKLTPVDAATFSYAMGVGQSESLKSFLLQREALTAPTSHLPPKP